MPAKAPPRIYQLLVKTHTLTIIITAEPKSTIASLKLDVLSALKADVNQVDDVPAIESEEDFEISQFPKARGKQGVQTYEVLRESATVAETCANWEVLFLQFRDASGKLMPVQVTQPSLFDEEEEEAPRTRGMPASDAPSGNKGKRKAPEE
ncbi:hypothetical protein FIBSPDRAFT_503321 [Athelia psychrophila]|uniref:Uncharacterized protein n=1 Tax=Athelia psychrophila TaxID=1759441 RepID=A0A166K5G8_9AGAM|nr:hypothetical protein FIBSPDRAFT_503321 [Fibularhizoctonia sp. CBS 109695]